MYSINSKLLEKYSMNLQFHSCECIKYMKVLFFQLFFILFATENVDAKEKKITDFSDFWIIVTQELDYRYSFSKNCTCILSLSNYFIGAKNFLSTL